MPYVVLGLSFCLVAWGVFVLLHGIFDTTLPPNARVGKHIRGAFTELAGLVLWGVSLGLGAKPALAVPVLVAAMSISGLAGVAHGFLRRKMPR